ncbi:hypothetical protein [Deinococcus sp.]|uniref:hypothetical protein n=1 Tax=Deinococcus sp. TaxID=47478 RepID=UPI0025D64507|nr:hypothetical protein [Deinococcus sp.]
MRPLRASPFPRWAPAAAAGRLLLSLLALALLGVAFVYSLRPTDPHSVRDQAAQVETVLGEARRLDLRLPSELARHLKLVSRPASRSAVFAARLTGSRPGALTVRRRSSGAGPNSAGPNSAGTRLDLRRALGELPTFIQIGASSTESGVPDTLSLSVPEGVPLSLWLTHSADDAALDLRRLDLEALNFTSDSGDLSATLPERGRPQLRVSTDTGHLELTVPPGPAQTNLVLSSGSGEVRLKLPPTAQVRLDLRLGDQDPSDPDEVNLPASLRFVTLIGKEGQVRRYVQTGRPGGPRLRATLTLGSGALSVQTSPVQLISGETP